MYNTILFDYGGTLVSYYETSERDKVLAESIAEVSSFLTSSGRAGPTVETALEKFNSEPNHYDGYKVNPLEDRLPRAFSINPPPELPMEMCRAFLKPIFARAYLYRDAITALANLKSRGFRMAIVSNAAWASPATFWREEIVRHGIRKHVDTVVMCRDVGYRKPAPQIFKYTLDKLQVAPEKCLFVGDNMLWDVEGPQSAGIDAMLLDRNGTEKDFKGKRIKDLIQLLEMFRSL